MKTKPIIEIIKELDKTKPIYKDACNVPYIDALLELSKDGVISHELIDDTTLAITLNNSFYFRAYDSEDRELTEEFNSYNELVEYIDGVKGVSFSFDLMTFDELMQEHVGHEFFHDGYEKELRIELYDFEQRSDTPEVLYDLYHDYTYYID